MLIMGAVVACIFLAPGLRGTLDDVSSVISRSANMLYRWRHWGNITNKQASRLNKTCMYTVPIVEQNTLKIKYINN